MFHVILVVLEGQAFPKGIGQVGKQGVSQHKNQ